MPEEKLVFPTIVEAQDYTSTDLCTPVKLRLGESGTSARKPISASELLNRAANFFTNRPALHYQGLDKEWNTVSFIEYEIIVRKFSKIFIKLGLRPHHAVGILAYNCPEWFYANLATIIAGGVVAGIYTTNSAEATYHVLVESMANICVVDDMVQMEKVYVNRHRLPNLRAVVQINGPFAEYVKSSDGLWRWSEIEELVVDDQIEDAYQQRQVKIGVNHVATLVYTSGTVGNPKGVMLSQDNIIFDALSLQALVSFTNNDILISYLPLSHIAAQMTDIYESLWMGMTVYFADRNALKGTLVDTMKYARPTIFLAVPRVYEKIHDKIVQATAQASPLKNKIASWARNAALSYHMSSAKEKSGFNLQYYLAKLLVLNKIKVAIGLDRAVSIVSSAAPISPELRNFFLSLDIQIQVCYGTSEVGGAQTMSPKESSNMLSNGKSIEGSEIIIKNKDAYGHGEICIRGRNVFMGYLGDTDKENAEFDEKGFFSTGDKGYLDDKGELIITGRLKEIIITAGGENIPPVRVEDLVKAELPFVSNAVLIGEQRKFLSILLTLKTKMDPDTGAPLDELLPEAQEFMKTLGLNHKTVKDVISAGPCPILSKAIEKGIIEANKSAISNAQKVQKFTILPQDLSIPTGELGPTLKTKRSFINHKYKGIIDKTYMT